MQRAIGWMALVAGVGAVHGLTADSPPILRMLALIAVALLAMKAIVVIEESARGMLALRLGPSLAFAFGWLGMRPRVFAARADGPLPGASSLLRRGAVFLLLGTALVALARLDRGERIAATAILLVGLSLALHFGVCNLLAGFWRSRGFDCGALFRAPLASTSLGEFWSRRWNLAFSEMTAISVFRPLAPHVSRGSALLAGFTLSGLLHEVAISLPVRAGFGLPLLYFLIQGALVILEERTRKFGRLATLVVVALPLPLLFHPPFLDGVIRPIVAIAR